MRAQHWYSWMALGASLTLACAGDDAATTGATEATTEGTTADATTTGDATSTTLTTITGTTTAATTTTTTTTTTTGPTTSTSETSTTTGDTTGDTTTTTGAAVCGDGLVEGGEACDDGNDDNTDACLDTCVLAACGDGYVQVDVEACDDGNDDNTDACTDACALPSCGDGYVQGDEACDDANPDNTDACLDTCVAASCGDGYVQAGVEACDDQNDDNADACTTLCQAPACDDSLQSGGESDVDCGGPECPKCPVDAQCNDHSDCETDACIAGACGYFDTCKELKTLNPAAPSGKYTIDGGQNQLFEVYCDQETDGGGWTILWASDGGDNQPPMTGDPENLAGDPLSFQPYNLTRARKILLSGLGGETLVRRAQGNAWIKADHAPFDPGLAMANQHRHVAVTLTASDGASAAGFLGYSNFNISGGGDFNLSTVDGATCNGVTTMGSDHHSPAYYHLNCGCQRHYLYSYSANTGDSDGSYKVNTTLGAWSATAACTSSEGGGLALYLAVR